MAEPMLTQFLNKIFLPKLPYCVVCLRTEAERRLEEPVHLKRFILSLNQPYPFSGSNQLICYLCNRQAVMAYKFRLAANLASQTQQVLSQLRRSSVLLNKFISNYYVHSLEADAEVDIRKDSVGIVMQCELNIRRQRTRSQLLQTEVLHVSSPEYPTVTPSLEIQDQQTDKDQGTYIGEFTRQGECSDLYVIPDDVTRIRQGGDNVVTTLAEPETSMESIIIYDDDDPISITKTSDNQPLLINTTMALRTNAAPEIPVYTVIMGPKPAEPARETAVTPEIHRTNTAKTNPRPDTYTIRIAPKPAETAHGTAVTPEINREITAKVNPRPDTANAKHVPDTANAKHVPNTASANPKQHPAKSSLSNAKSTATDRITIPVTAGGNLQDPPGFMLHPIVFNSGMMTVPSLGAQIVNGYMMMPHEPNSIVPQIAMQNGESLFFVSDPSKVTNVLKMMSHHDAHKVHIFTNATVPTPSPSTSTQTERVTAPSQNSLSGVTQPATLNNKNGDAERKSKVPLKSPVNTSQRLLAPFSKGYGPMVVEAHSLAEKDTATLTSSKSGEINWEDKIPMDVISFMDADENSNKRARMTTTPPLPALGIVNVTSPQDTGQDDVIDLC